MPAGLAPPRNHCVSPARPQDTVVELGSSGGGEHPNVLGAIGWIRSKHVIVVSEPDASAHAPISRRSTAASARLCLWGPLLIIRAASTSRVALAEHLHRKKSTKRTAKTGSPLKNYVTQTMHSERKPLNEDGREIQRKHAGAKFMLSITQGQAVSGQPSTMSAEILFSRLMIRCVGRSAPRRRFATGGGPRGGCARRSRGGSDPGSAGG